MQQTGAALDLDRTRSAVTPAAAPAVAPAAGSAEAAALAAQIEAWYNAGRFLDLFDLLRGVRIGSAVDAAQAAIALAEEAEARGEGAAHAATLLPFSSGPGSRGIAQTLPLIAGLHGAQRLGLSRLLAQLGDDTGSDAQELRAYREAPDDAEVCAYRTRALAALRSPVAAWEFVRARGDRFATATPHGLADWWCVQAQLCDDVRDLAASQQCLARAREAAPDDPWPLVAAGYSAARADRRDEALALATQALAMRPWYRPAVQHLASLHVAAGRRDAAIDLLQRATAANQAASLRNHLAAELEVAGQWRASLTQLAAMCAYSPLAEAGLLRMAAARRSDLRYRLGDRAGTIAEAERSTRPGKTSFFACVAANLAAAPADAPRVELDVPRLLQDHMTCVPTTLAMLARYWGRNEDQRALSDAICYDGTPDHVERAWAEDADFATAEFTVTWAASVALLNRGIPFTLTTRGPSYAHLQAVIGYDAARGALLIADPGSTWPRESLARGSDATNDLLIAQQASGPRGMALVPRELAGELRALALPDAELWDALNRVRSALAAHDRVRAVAALHELTLAAPEHRLALAGQRELMWYDGDVNARAALTRRLRQRYPDNDEWVLIQAGELTQTGTRSERIDLLRAAAARPGADLAIERALAVELGQDARDAAEARRRCCAVLRYRTSDARAWTLLGDLDWQAGARHAAVTWYRAAAKLELRHGHCALSYARACRWTGAPGEGEAFLRQRVADFGAKAAEPHLTLAAWFDDLDRSAAAEDTVRAGLAVGLDASEVGLLRLALAERLARRNAHAEAAALVAEAQVAPDSRLRTAAELAALAGDTQASLRHWRDLAALQPQDTAAHAAIAALLSRRNGPDAGIAHLDAVLARFPFSAGLALLRLQQLRNEGDALHDGATRLRQAARLYVQRHGDDPFGWRELGFLAAQTGDFAEASAASAAALERDPHHSAGHALAGEIATLRGDAVAARQHFLAALHRDADDTWSLQRLLSLAADSTAAAADLRLVAAELKRQTTDGRGLRAWSEHAVRHLPPPDVETVLREAVAERPDLRAMRTTLLEHLRHRGETDAALAVARQASVDFDRDAAAWYDLAQAAHDAGDSEGERQAYDRAVALAPRWWYLLRERALAMEQRGDRAAAQAELARCCAAAPQEAGNFGVLGGMLLRAAQPGEAAHALTQAVLLDPAYSWAFDRLAEIDAEQALRVARRVVDERPGLAAAWLRLAEILGRHDGDTAITITDEQRLALREERLLACNRALPLAPRLPDVHVARALALAALDRHDEADAACDPAVFAGAPPPALRLLLARLRRRRGDAAAALTVLHALLVSDPAHYQALAECCETESELNDHAAARRSGEALVAHYPMVAQAYGYLGDALRLGGDLTAARQAFERAIALDPDYLFAQQHLAQLALDAGDLATARRAQDQCEQRETSPWSDRLRVLIECATPGAKPEHLCALPALQRLCTTTDTYDATVDAALTALLKVPGARARLGPQLDAWLRQGPLHSRAARTWLELIGAQQRTDVLVARLESVIARSSDDYPLVIAGIEHLADHGKMFPFIGLFRRHVRLLARETSLWGAVGYALHELDLHDNCVDWMLRSRYEHPDVEAWMLVNPALSLRNLQRDAEAADVSRQALRLPESPASRMHRLMLALDAALAGRGAEAHQLSSGDPPTHVYWQMLKGFVQALLPVADDTAPLAPAAAWKAFAAVRAAHGPHLRTSGAAIIRYRRAIAARIAARQGGLRGQLCRMWYLLR